MEVVSGRVPPSDLDGEGAVLSACMLDPAAVDVVRAVIPNPRSMYADANFRILDAIYSLADAGTPPDIVGVAGYLRDKGRLDQIGGTPYLATLADATPSVAHVEDHAKRVVEKARVRGMISVCQKFAADGYGDIGPVDEWLGAAEQAVFDAASLGAQQDVGETIGEILKPVLDDIWDRQAGRVTVALGVSTSVTALTTHTNGWRRGKVHIVCARPGLGKTAFGLGNAIKCAKTGELAAFVSLEMEKWELVIRALAHEARVDAARLEKGIMNQVEVARVMAAAEALADLPLVISFIPGATVAQVRSEVRRAVSEDKKRRGDKSKLGLVAVDYVQLMHGSSARNYANREAEVASISRGLVQLAGETRAAVLALCQLNREVESRGAGGKDKEGANKSRGKRPLMSDLRESGALEQDAFTVLGLYRDEYYFPDTIDKGIAELIVLKLRNGPFPWTIRTKFTGEYTRFDDLAPEEYNFADHELDPAEGWNR